MEQQIGRPAPGLIVLQPSFYEGLCPQVIGLAPGNRDAVAGVSRVRCAVPATMLGNEELVLIRGGELSARGKGNPQGSNVGPERERGGR